MGDRTLATRVAVGGRWYGPEDGPIPDEVAAKIRNPKVWASAGDAQTSKKAAKAGAPTGARLARAVSVGGRWYGPDDEIPADVAAKIRNPKAWADGVMPDSYDNGGFLAPASEKLAEGDGLVAGDTGTGDDLEETSGTAMAAPLEEEPQEDPKPRKAAAKKS